MQITMVPKLILPIAFFGYAAVANLSLLSGAEDAAGSLEFALNGSITQEIDTLYRDNLPHKDPAIGVIGAARYVLLDEGRNGVVVGQDGVLFTAEEYRALDPDAALYQQALAEIADTAERLRAEGVELVMLPLPAKVDLLRNQAADPGQGAAFEAFYAAFLRDLKQLQIATLDVRPAMVETQNPFLATDTHWSVEGAQAVASVVSTSAFVELGETQFDVVSEDRKTFVGDLVSYVTTDALAPMVGLDPEKIAVLTVEAQNSADLGGGLDLFGAATGDAIDLVGTSYSANADWSFVEALKLALSRDVINHAQEGRGPVAPMRDYVQRRQSAGGADTVIWEFPIRYLTDPKLLAGDVS